MAQIFELSAALTLDTAGFLGSIRQAEEAARRLQSTLSSRMSTAAASMRVLQSAAGSTWSSIAASIQMATERLREFSVVSMASGAPRLQGYATGLSYVPYNDFPARLHEGEAVLTKSQASQWRSGASAQPVSIDYDRLAAAVASAMGGMSVQMDGHAVGVMVAPTVSAEMGRQSKSRRYTG